MRARIEISKVKKAIKSKTDRKIRIARESIAKRADELYLSSI